MEAKVNIGDIELNRIGRRWLVKTLYNELVKDFDASDDIRHEEVIILSRDDSWLIAKIRALLNKAHQARR